MVPRPRESGDPRPGRGASGAALESPAPARGTPRQREVAAAPPRGGAKKLIIADDDPALRLLVRATLRSKEYEILEATDGPSTLALARQHRPDLVLLDVNMPGMDGFRICELLKQDPATAAVTVVMLTVQVRVSDRRRARQAGADGYFTKPFSPMALIRKVEQVMGGTT